LIETIDTCSLIDCMSQAGATSSELIKFI